MNVMVCYWSQRVFVIAMCSCCGFRWSFAAELGFSNWRLAAGESLCWNKWRVKVSVWMETKLLVQGTKCFTVSFFTLNTV